MKTAVVLLVLVIFAGCSSRSLLVGSEGNVDLQPALDHANAIDLADADLVGSDFASASDLGQAAIGDPCTLPAYPTQEGLVSGTCGEGLLCVGPHLNAPGGYCTRSCDLYAEPSDCDESSYCAHDPSYLCMKRCTSGNDCRKGYVCRKDEFELDDYKTCQVESPK